MKIAIVYYSGTGNTEAMANKIYESLKDKADVDLFTSDSFDPSKVDEYDAFAFGCPAMGDEVLEEDSFEPMFLSIESSLGEKKTALFGSYGWGVGDWMESWKARCSSCSINVVGSVIAQDAPDDSALMELEALANALL